MPRKHWEWAAAIAFSTSAAALAGTSRIFMRWVGSSGRICGIDISRGMLRKAQQVRRDNGWQNITLTECDAAEYVAPEPLDAVLFSLSFNTMPHQRAVLWNVWNQIRPRGRLVIMDAKVPPGLGGRLILPFSLWLMKRTMLGNPLIHPQKCLARSLKMSR
jgi:ubiquinone/menaquinone biosynthesis C-methylase UbiE